MTGYHLGVRIYQIPPSAHNSLRFRHHPACINPDHQEVGTRADNKHYDWEFVADGGELWW